MLSAVCFTAVSVWIGAFQDSAVLNKLADTGYYRTIFEELRRDTSISFALLDIPDNVMDGAITYERVVLAARQRGRERFEPGRLSGRYVHADRPAGGRYQIVFEGRSQLP